MPATAQEASRRAVEDEIRGMVDRETRAWDSQDTAALVDPFHPDWVRPWPPDAAAHDPARRVAVSAEGDGAFAEVDVDTRLP